MAALLTFAGPAGAGRDLSESERQAVRGAADRYRRVMHWSKESLDLDAVVEAVDPRMRTGSGTVALDPWITEAAIRQWSSWIPTDAKPQYEFQYGYPLDVLVERLVWRAAAGDLEFLATVGTPVYAARQGTVARVIDGFSGCCLPDTQRWKTNQVIVVHDDGTIAYYERLRPGIQVDEGQPVAQGDLLAYSGFTGATEVPGLHFRLWVLDGAGGVEMLPMRFRDGSAEGAVLTTGHRVQERPASNVRLRLFSDGKRFKPRQTEPATVGQRIRLKARLRDASREEVEPERWGWVPDQAALFVSSSVDVTQDRRTRFDTPTPWLVEITGFGVVRFRREAWKGPVPEGSVATVTAVYEDREEGVVGYAEVHFELAESGDAP